MNNYIIEQDEYILDMYLNEDIDYNDILDLYEYGYISEDVLEYIEEGKITRGIRELGHNIVKRFIQPKLSRNYKRDAYAHELKHVRRQLNDARKEGNQKVIDYYKNKANEIKTKGNNTGWAYSTIQSVKTGGKGYDHFYKINGYKGSKPLRFNNKRENEHNRAIQKKANFMYKAVRDVDSHFDQDFKTDLSKSLNVPNYKDYKVHIHDVDYRDDKNRIRPALTLYDKHTRRGNVIKLLNAISKEKE